MRRSDEWRARIARDEEYRQQWDDENRFEQVDAKAPEPELCEVAGVPLENDEETTD